MCIQAALLCLTARSSYKKVAREMRKCETSRSSAKYKYSAAAVTGKKFRLSFRQRRAILYRCSPFGRARREAVEAELARVQESAVATQVAVAEAPGGLASLFALAGCGTPAAKAVAEVKLMDLLSNLKASADSELAIAEAGGLAPLIALLRDGTPGCKEATAGSLWYLACHADNQAAIAQAGGRPHRTALRRHAGR